LIIQIWSKNKSSFGAALVKVHIHWLEPCTIQCFIRGVGKKFWAQTY